ncbi:MAG: hypothetical protein UX60_C0032G0006 [Berkelbacteria bacterium GW2011_GWA2_46_7]|uniref:THIF-type NAD/FAD binding fold domain-containing protein n=1 Tax=Berkelbacteria bacterium GW2011_GWA2_46_7 TaxID=1618335 RepID=A0A0G1QDY6_9BACT|nr:MAG: hypothetical protein UX60_C0032G0006 [Berkelbacteria bacterium GW2011_GWA2_46_7]
MNEEYEPRFFQSREQDQVKVLIKDRKICEVIDNFSEELENLFRINFPFITPATPEYGATLQKFLGRYLDGKKETEAGVWAYYPWRQILVHLPESADFLKLRTSRNKFLINNEEQQKFYNSKIGVAGLSVGLAAVNSLVLSGGGGQMSEINPFQILEVFQDGITTKNISKFFGTESNKLDIFIEEIDDIKLKIDTRIWARKLKIPVVMATDNGDNAMIDVERFDLEPNRKLFHSRIEESRLLSIGEKLNMTERIKLASAIVGADITPRTRMSLTMVGTKLPAWPQLGNAATLSGVAVSYISRRILTGLSMPSGRYEVSLDEKFDPSYFESSSVRDREIDRKEFIFTLNKIFGS